MTFLKQLLSPWYALDFLLTLRLPFHSLLPKSAG